jgi:hypothetical protein
MRISNGPTWIPLNDGLGIDPTGTKGSSQIAPRRLPARAS